MYMYSRALIVRGHQGVGKTTLAEHLASRNGFCRVSKDEFYNPVMSLTGNHKVSSRIAYSAIQAVLLSNAQSGINFVVDAPFNGSLKADEFYSRIRSVGIIARGVVLVCSDLGDWEDRLSARTDDSTPSHLLTTLEEIVQYRGSLDPHPLASELVLDSSHTPISIMADICTNYLLHDEGGQ